MLRSAIVKWCPGVLSVIVRTERLGLVLTILISCGVPVRTALTCRCLWVVLVLLFADLNVVRPVSSGCRVRNLLLVVSVKRVRWRCDLAVFLSVVMVPCLVCCYLSVAVESFVAIVITIAVTVVATCGLWCVVWVSCLNVELWCVSIVCLVRKVLRLLVMVCVDVQ